LKRSSTGGFSPGGLKVAIFFDRRGSPDYAVTQIVTAFGTRGELSSPADDDLVIKAMPVMKHLINAGFWNLIARLIEFVRHNTLIRSGLRDQAQLLAPNPILSCRSSIPAEHDENFERIPARDDGSL
jgi:hypothetical protein